MIGDKSSALSSEIRIFFREPTSQSLKDADGTQQAPKRLQGKQGSSLVPPKMQVSPQKQVAYTSAECQKDPEVFGEEDQSIDQFQDYTQIQSEYEQLKRWFEGLSVAERVNCLTTTYPSLVSKLIEAHFEMRDNGVLSLFKRHTSASPSIYSVQSQSSYSQGLGFGLGINISAQNQYKQQMQAMYARYDSKIQQHTGYGQKTPHQSSSKQAQNQTTLELPIFEMVKSEESQIRNLGSQNARCLQEEFLKHIRVTDYMQQFDTLTVSPGLVSDPSKFFSLVAEITSHKAFREPAIFKQKGSRVKIDSPAWSKKVETTYLSIWIVIALEESLWAHFNFANKVNIDRNVRQDTLSNMFKERAESLFSQDDLAKRWHEIGNLGRKRLIEKLKLKAKETFEVYQGSEAQHALEDVHMVSDDYNCTALNIHGFNGYQTEELVNAFAQNQKSQYQNQSPYSQFYTFHKIPLRPQFSRSYNELFLSDPDSAFARMQNHDRDVQEILDFVQTDWAHITPLDVIKFLSETPIEEMDSSHRARKTFLCRELHSLVQEDLRQSIQNQLMSEDLFAAKPKTQLQTQVNSMHLNSAAVPSSSKKQKIGQTQPSKPEVEQTRVASPAQSKSGNRKKKGKKVKPNQVDGSVVRAEEVDEQRIAGEPEVLQKCKSAGYEKEEGDLIGAKEIEVVNVVKSDESGKKDGESDKQGKKEGIKNKKRTKGKPSIQLVSQAEDLTSIEKSQKKVGSIDTSEQHRKDWVQRQTNSSAKRQASQRSPTYSSQICEVTGSSTHSFDDEKFCIGTGPSSGGGPFSDDNITQNEGENKRATKNQSNEILLLDCSENDLQRKKTANFLSKIKTERQPQVLKNDKPQKRADSGDDKADWSTVGSGLLMIPKQSSSRESEPEQTLKQQLDFQHIFEHDASTADPKTTVQTSKDSSQKTRQSTISDKAKTKAAPTHLKAPLRDGAKPQVDSDSSPYANLNVLSASQSVDFITKKSLIQNDKLTKSSHAFGERLADVKIDFKEQAKPKRNRSGRKKRSQGRSSPEATEEAILIRHFVTSLIDRACSIVMRDQKECSEESGDVLQEENFADALEERKEPFVIQEINQSQASRTKGKQRRKEGKPPRSNEKVQQHSDSDPASVKYEIKLTNIESKASEREQKDQVQKISPKSPKLQKQEQNSQPSSQQRQSEQNSWRQPIKTKDAPKEPKEKEDNDSEFADVKQKKKRQRIKKKNDNEIALNNFMRQVAGDHAGKEKPEKGRNDRNDQRAKQRQQRSEKHAGEDSKRKQDKAREEEKESSEATQDKGSGRRRKGSRQMSGQIKPVEELPLTQEESTAEVQIEVQEGEKEEIVVEEVESVAEIEEVVVEEIAELQAESMPSDLPQVQQQPSVSSTTSSHQINEEVQFHPTEPNPDTPLDQDPRDDNNQELWSYSGVKNQSFEYSHEGSDDRRNPKFYNKFDNKGKPMRSFQKNQGPQHMNKWNDRRRDQYDNGQGGNQQWQGNQFNQPRNYHYGGQYQNRQYGYSGQQRYYDYNRDKYSGEQYNENNGDFYDNNNQTQQLPPFAAQTPFGGQDQGGDNWTRKNYYQQSSKPFQDENMEESMRKDSVVSNEQAITPPINVQLSEQAANPFLKGMQQSSFVPQSESQASTPVPDAKPELASVIQATEVQDGIIPQPIQDINFGEKLKDFAPEEISKQSSVWSQQSNPFRPNEGQQSWTQTGLQSNFYPSRPVSQYESANTSPVQQPTYVKVNRNTLPSNQFGDQPSTIQSVDRPQYLGKQNSFQPRVPQFDRPSQELPDQSRQALGVQRVQSTMQPATLQEPLFDNFGFGLQNRRVGGGYQQAFQTPPLIMKWIDGVGDPMSMFNDTDPQQKVMQADTTYRALEDQFYRDFDASVKEYTGRITESVEKYKAEREAVLLKIQTIANKVYTNQNPQIMMFGSLITGLALESSDMDMVVQGLNISDRQVMIDEMHNLADGLAQWDLVEDLKPIDTASIPVIKAKVNLRVMRSRESGEPMSDSESTEYDWLPIDITFDDSPSQSYSSPQQSPNQSQDFNLKFGGNQYPSNFAAQQYQPANFGFDGFQNNQKFGYQASPFGGDSVVPEEQNFVPPSYLQSQKTHLGLASCRLIKDYVTTYPHLREVAVLLKTFLAQQDLNSAYLGGISSYSAVLLIVAYMNYFKLQHNPNITPSRLLMGFLDFYSNCFDPGKFGVKTMNQMSYYALTSMNQPMFVIVDPVNPSNNTARNSFRTPDVLKSFRDAFKRLKSLIYGHYQNTLSSADGKGAKEALALTAAEAGTSGDVVQAQPEETKDSPESLQADHSKVFCSVDFVRTFLSSGQADLK